MKSFATRLSANLGKADKPKPLAWLISELDQDVGHEHLSHAERDNYLEQLKTYTRSVEESAPLCTKQGVLLLCRHGFDHGTAKTSRTALKSLANVMLLAPGTRQQFVDLDYAGRAAELLKHDNREDEFLASRVLFLLTYGTTFDFNVLFTQHQLIETINSNIAQHAKYMQSGSRKRVPSVGDAANPGPQLVDLKAIEAQEQSVFMALSETLKFLFNLAHFYADAKPAFSKSLLPILKLLQRIKITSPPLQPPLIYVINALLELDLDQKALFPAFDSKCNVDRLILILDLALRQQSDDALEKTTQPLLTLVRRIFEVAPKGIKAHLRDVLLPTNKDREKPLGQSDSMSSRLLRLSASATAPNMSKSVQEMFFEISDKDVNKFVRNIGYGFASGFLMSHNLEVPGNAFDAWSERGPSMDGNRIEEVGSDEEDADEAGVRHVAGASGDAAGGRARVSIPVNPITGQRTDMEKPEEEDPRTEEEKIREAERLFVLFERLRATGVVDVENPVAKAAREGKLQ